MSVIPVCEEFVSAFGSRSMSSADKNNLCDSCKRLIALYGTNEFAVPWRCTCNATPNPDNQGESVQMKITTQFTAWFSEDDLKLWRRHRKVRGFAKSGRNGKKVS